MPVRPQARRAPSTLAKQAIEQFVVVGVRQSEVESGGEGTERLGNKQETEALLMKRSSSLWTGLLTVFALVAVQLTPGRVQPAAAAPGDVVADVDASLFATVGVSVAFDGQFLYFTNLDDQVMHRINVPPIGLSPAT